MAPIQTDAFILAANMQIDCGFIKGYRNKLSLFFHVLVHIFAVIIIQKRY